MQAKLFGPRGALTPANSRDREGPLSLRVMTLRFGWFQGSQRELKLLGRQQINLLNLWTKAMAERVVSSIETSPAAQNSLITLAAAEAPFADPFLLEFEDPEALKNAYTETPITFEQALMNARLEAKMATQVRLLSSLLGYIPNGSPAESPSPALCTFRPLCTL